MFTRVAHAIAIDIGAVGGEISAIGRAFRGVFLRRARAVAADDPGSRQPIPTIDLAGNRFCRVIDFPRIAMVISAHAIEIICELAIDVAVLRCFLAAANAIAARAILVAVERVFSGFADAIGCARATCEAGIGANRAATPTTSAASATHATRAAS